MRAVAEPLPQARVPRVQVPARVPALLPAAAQELAQRREESPVAGAVAEEVAPARARRSMRKFPREAEAMRVLRDS